MRYAIIVFISLFMYNCSSPDFRSLDEHSQARPVTIEELVKKTDSLDSYLIFMMPIWCSGSKWLVKEKIASLSDSLEANNISYFYILLGKDYASIRDFVAKNNLNKPYYLIKDEWQGNGILDRSLINKISSRLRVDRRDNSVPFGFFLDRKNRKIAYSVNDYTYIVSSLEEYRP